MIALAEGDRTRGSVLIGSPLALAAAMRSLVNCCLAAPDWRREADEAVAIARGSSAMTYVTVIVYKYVPVLFGAISLDGDVLAETAEALRIAEQSGDNFTLGLARFARGIALIHRDGTGNEEGLAELAKVRESSTQQRLSMTVLPAIETYFARERARAGDLDAAIAMSRAVVDDLYRTGEVFTRGMATAVLVELLLGRGESNDLREAQGAIDRLAAVPTDPGFVLHELPLLRLRALLARSCGDEAGYRDFKERYRAMADSVDYQGHVALAESMG